ncbi:MAG: hypothetical protein JJU02_14445 [Cryomorphaceae bacterium]|nr:hypothetical protein [Cryomorphaceae bacterium]
MINDIAYGLGDFFTWSFKILPTLGHGPNIIIALVITGYFIYWLKQIKKHKEAGEN